EHGIKLVSDGTDTHMVLLDFSARGLSGQQVQDSLARVNLTSNKNPIPFDSSKPSEWVGLRLGVAAATTRGLQADEFKLLGEIIARTIESCERKVDDQILQDQHRVLQLCKRFPIYR
ncbi:MAG: serine hydroxymethyltransferase, partial [Gammaproteobacteria bacterium]|nr:serine hydroxymethyltransferase [Gammaproteobacteria bacterium]